MAKVVETIVRPTTASRIEDARRSIAETELEIQDLRAAQSSALLEDDEREALKVASQITAAETRLTVRRERLRALQQQSRREVQDNRAQRKAAALTVFEQKFTDRVTAAAIIDKALVELNAGLARYAAACGAPFAEWPDVFPSSRIYGHYGHNSLQQQVVRSIGPGARRTEFEAREAETAAELIEDIRKAPLPELPHVDEDEVNERAA